MDGSGVLGSPVVPGEGSEYGDTATFFHVHEPIGLWAIEANNAEAEFHYRS
jgi:hypothetical protein